ncbi:hypothetical protein HanIR_Chr02g0073791 [Helianthus annuus]|nr:hypothetical protein HanIR_Chr02g0073791 [Helianthus annuus]
MRGDRRRCVKNRQNGSVKAGGFGFVSFGTLRNGRSGWLVFFVDGEPLEQG